MKIIDYTDGLTLIDNGDKEIINKTFIVSNTTDIELILTNKINIEENE